MKSSGNVESLVEPKPLRIVAQEDAPIPDNNGQIDPNKLREDLKIDPLLKVMPAERKRTYSPSLNFASPSAFGANWGDVFLGLLQQPPVSLELNQTVVSVWVLG